MVKEEADCKNDLVAESCPKTCNVFVLELDFQDLQSEWVEKLKKYILLYEISIGRGGGRAWRSLRNSQSCLEAGATVDQNKQKDKKVC